MRARRLTASIAVLILLIGTAAWLGTGQALSFRAANYYIFPLGGPSVDVESLLQTAQAEGYAVIRYDGTTAVAYEGDQVATQAVDLLLGSPSLLIVDGGRFLLKSSAGNSTFAVRPGTDGLELVFSPQEDQTMDEVISVLLELERIGILSDEVDFEFHEYAKDALKGPAPPTGARIDSNLFGLTVSEDWHAYAASKGLTLVGLRVEVVAELLPGSVLPAEFESFVSSEGESLVGLLLPVDQLVALATAEGIGLVREPYEPIAP
jgi:hypothetical protein